MRSTNTCSASQNNRFANDNKRLFPCSVGPPHALACPSFSREQRWCRVIKTSVEVTGSPEGMQHCKAPLLSCFLCELSRPQRIYSSTAQHSPPTPPPRQMSPSSLYFWGQTQDFLQSNKPHAQAINRTTGVWRQHQHGLFQAEFTTRGGGSLASLLNSGASRIVTITPLMTPHT